MTFSKVAGNGEKQFFIHLHILCKSYDTLIMPIWQIKVIHFFQNIVYINGILV